MERMDDFIGILELVVWISCVVILAASVTYAVVKIFPGSGDKTEPEESAPASGQS
jgi:hypothetical protein